MKILRILCLISVLAAMLASAPLKGMYDISINAKDYKQVDFIVESAGYSGAEGASGNRQGRSAAWWATGYVKNKKRRLDLHYMFRDEMHQYDSWEAIQKRYPKGHVIKVWQNPNISSDDEGQHSLDISYGKPKSVEEVVAVAKLAIGIPASIFLFSLAGMIVLLIKKRRLAN